MSYTTINQHAVEIISIDVPGLRPGSRVMGCPDPDNDDVRTAGMVKMMLGKILGVYNRLEKQRSGTVTVIIHPNGIGMVAAGFQVPRRGRGLEDETDCRLDVPVTGLRGQPFAEWVVRQPIQTGQPQGQLLPCLPRGLAAGGTLHGQTARAGVRAGRGGLLG